MKIRLPIVFVATALLGQQIPTAAPQAGAGQNAAPQTVEPSPTKPDDLGAMEGQVTSVETGAPVKKAELVLQRVDLNRETASVPTSYTTTSDAGGKFAMKDLEPGKYRLSVTCNGFVRGSYGSRGPNRPGATLSLDPGQHLKQVDFKLTPHGVVTGRVVDQDGDPLANVNVQAQTYRRQDGRKQLFPAGSASTNDLGEYRIFGLAPGRYYLSAANNRIGYEPAMRESSAKPPPEESYVPTYYPAGIDIAMAAAVDLTAGAQMHGMNIALSKAHTVRVRGHIDIQPGADKLNTTVMLTPRNGSDFNPMGNRHAADAQGNFEIRGVRPGTYWLVAMSFGPERLSARQILNVGDSNLDNLTVELSRGVEIAGQIKAENPDKVNLTDIYVSMRTRERMSIYFGPTPSDHVKQDGSFTLSQVGQDVYDVYVGGMPDGYYVKSVRAGDQEVRDSGLDMTNGAAGPLTITIGPGAGQIDGTVQNEKQQPAAGASVVLIPNDPKLRERRDAYNAGSSDQNGRFTLKNIVPGEYKLYAWDDMESGAYMDPDVVKPFESQGVAMSIQENGKESAQLNLIAAEKQ